MASTTASSARRMKSRPRWVRQDSRMEEEDDHPAEILRAAGIKPADVRASLPEPVPLPPRGAFGRHRGLLDVADLGGEAELAQGT